MKIDEERVRYVADLANLSLGDSELSRFAGDLSEILTYVERLNELDTTGVEPMAQVLYDAAGSSTLRDDTPGATLLPETAVENSALSGSGHFKVPKVVDR